MERPSPHEGSKRRFTQHADLAQDRPSRIARAQAWSQFTGRPVPPHMRFRRPAALPSHADPGWRWSRYAGLPDARISAQDALDSPLLTPVQRRRMRRKAGHNGERPAGWVPAAFRAPGPRRPGTPAQLRRARRNAAQQARHERNLRAGHVSAADAQLRRIVPPGPLDAVHGQVFGRRGWRVAESAPSEWVR